MKESWFPNLFSKKEQKTENTWLNSDTAFSQEKFPIFSVNENKYKLWYSEGYNSILIRVVPLDTNDDFKDTALHKIAEVGFQKQKDGMYTADKLDSKKEKGLARAMYDFMDLRFGKIKPSSNQSELGNLFWEKNKLHNLND
jgi:hypothetical protein